ncbi:MAG: ornithine cyclodeaminase family protein [Bacteroidales bacterium]|nr:ornithine cyclodeaminase family protein [Bacteroidales bacterium]
MRYFDGDTIERAATAVEWVEAMEKALAALVDGAFVLPRRMHLDRGNDTFLLMPCISDEYWSTKLVSFCPGNRDSGKPSIYGTVILNSSVTGEPLAAMDGTMITALRTAAVSAAGIRLLAGKEVSRVGIVGAGVQGLYQALFACSVRNIEEVRVFDTLESNPDRFRDILKSKRPGLKVIRCLTSAELARDSELVITATNSSLPVFPDEPDLFTGKTFVGIGSYKPDCREYPEQLFRQLSQVFADTTDGLHESGDLIDPVRNGWLDKRDIYPIGNLISGKVMLSPNPTRLFKTVGSAIFDLFAAKLVYENNMNRMH